MKKLLPLVETNNYDKVSNNNNKHSETFVVQFFISDLKQMIARTLVL